MCHTFAARTNWFVLPLVVFACLAIFGFDSSAADKKEDKKVAAPGLDGAWTFHGWIGRNGGVNKLDNANVRIVKFFSNGHWCVTKTNPQTGVVKYHHGGTYTLKDKQYAETIKYANESTRSMLNKTLHFKLHIDADVLVQKGLDNKFNEVWKRIKSDQVGEDGPGDNARSE